MPRKVRTRLPNAEEMSADPVEPGPGPLQLFQHHPGHSAPVAVGNEQHCKENKAQGLEKPAFSII